MNLNCNINDIKISYFTDNNLIKLFFQIIFSGYIFHVFCKFQNVIFYDIYISESVSDEKFTIAKKLKGEKKPLSCSAFNTWKTICYTNTAITFRLKLEQVLKSCPMIHTGSD